MFDLFPTRALLGGPWTDDPQGYQAALANFKRIKGCEPHPMMNAYTIYRDYRRIPTLDELAAQTADIGQRIAAVRAKYLIA